MLCICYKSTSLEVRDSLENCILNVEKKEFFIRLCETKFLKISKFFKFFRDPCIGTLYFKKKKRGIFI